MNKNLAIVGGCLLSFALICFSIWIYAAFKPKSGDGLLIGLFLMSAATGAVGVGMLFESFQD